MPNAVADYAKLSYRKETNWNETPPANMALKNLPFTKEALDYAKSTVVSNEIRSDRNVQDLVQVGVDAKGSVDFELSDYSEFFNTLLVAALFSSGSVLGGTAATGVLTSTANYANNDTVTIGSTVYTFKTALSTGPTIAYQIFIGANEAASIANLVAAINGAAGSGTTYSTGTVAHPSVTAVGATHTVTITAIVPGTGANSIATTKVAANATWGGTTMSGGANITLNANYQAVDNGTTSTTFTPSSGTPTPPPIGRAVLFQNLFVSSDTYVGIVTASNTTTGVFTISPGLASGGTTGTPVNVTGSATYNYREIKNGVTASSFFIEKLFSDINKSIAFSGMMLDSLKFTVDSRKIVNATANFIGGNGYEGNNYTVTSRDTNSGNVLSASGNVGAMIVNGSSTLIKTATVEIKNNLRGQDAIANLFLIGIGTGRCEVMLTLSAYFNSTTLYDIMIAHSSISAILGFTLSNTYAISMYFPKIKLAKALPDVGAINTEIMLAIDAQALLDSVTGASIVCSNAVNV